MSPLLQQVFDQIRGAWRFRWLAALAAIAVAVMGWAIVFSMPDRYEAAAQVLVDTRTALRPALQGLATGQDVSVPLDYVRQSLLVDAPLCRAALQAGILRSCADVGSLQPQLAGIRKRVVLNVQNVDDRSGQAGAAGLTFGITYQDENRAHALKLVSILLNTLETETLGGKRQGSENAQQFLQTQIQDYEKRLRSSEDSLAAFKSSHLGLLPNDDGGYFNQLQKETQAVEDSKTKLQAALNRRVTLESQLHGNAAVLASGAISAGNGANGAGVDTLSRIAQAQAQLDELLQRFTDKHPDVIAARANLAELKQRRTAEIQSLRSGDAAAAAASGAGGNPVFQSIQLALNQADVDIADLRSQLAQHETKVHDLRQLVSTAPQIEAEYAQLTRDYDVNKTQYAALLANYDKSKLGQRADDAGSVRFQEVQAPTVSYYPVAPKRSMLLVATLFAAFGAAGALAYALDQLQPVVGSATALTQLTGVPVLAAVGSAFPIRSGQRTRRELRHVAIIFGSLACALLVVLALSRAGVRLNIPALTHAVRSWA